MQPDNLVRLFWPKSLAKAWVPGLQVELHGVHRPRAEPSPNPNGRGLGGILQVLPTFRSIG
jgi:hypothetical protein